MANGAMKTVVSTTRDHGPEAELAMITLAFVLKKYVKKGKVKMTRKEWEGLGLHGTTVSFVQKGDIIEAELTGD